MAGKKAHKPRVMKAGGTHDAHVHADPPRKSSGETVGQYARDPKGRKGQYSGAGNSPVIKK